MSDDEQLQRAWGSTGFTQLTPARVDRLPEFDPRTGDHLWVVMPVYRIDPSKLDDPTHTPMLDSETLLLVTPPGCYYCEQPYAPRLLRRRCKGRP